MPCEGCARRRKWFKQFIGRKIMRGKVVTIWDGIQYRQVSPEEAARLVKKDMAQICPVGGTEMKFRRDFTGYQTREVRAEFRPAPIKEPEAKPVMKPEPEKEVVDWKDYRTAAAKVLDKPVNKTTKAQTLEYMEQNLGTED